MVPSRRVKFGNTFLCFHAQASVHTRTDYTVEQIVLVLSGTSLTDSMPHQKVAESDLLRKAERNFFLGRVPGSKPVAVLVSG